MTEAPMDPQETPPTSRRAQREAKFGSRNETDGSNGKEETSLRNAHHQKFGDTGEDVPETLPLATENTLPSRRRPTRPGAVHVQGIGSDSPVVAPPPPATEAPVQVQGTLVDNQALDNVRNQISSVELSMQERIKELELKTQQEDPYVQDKSGSNKWGLLGGVGILVLVGGLVGIVLGTQQENDSKSNTAVTDPPQASQAPTSSTPTTSPVASPIPRSFTTLTELEDALDAYLEAGYTTQGYGMHDVSVWDVSAVDSFFELFDTTRNEQMRYFNDPGINEWDSSSVTTMKWAFFGFLDDESVHEFNQPLNKWNVSRVSDFTGMFEGLKWFNQDLNAWDTSSATDMSWMFSDAYAFRGEIGSWNVSKVKIMQFMFQNAYVFNQDLSAWDVSSLEDAYGMFETDEVRPSSFNQPLNTWKVSTLREAKRMFLRASSFNQDLDSWDLSSVTRTEGMFEDAASFNGKVGSWNTSRVNDMAYMFLNTPFNQDVGNWDVSAVTTFHSMFEGAASFNQDISRWNVSKSSDYELMFKDATSFNQSLCDWAWNLSGAPISGVFGGTSCLVADTPNQTVSCWLCESSDGGL